MTTQRGKKARTDTTATGGLALPPTQPSTGSSTPAKAPGEIDPALQGQGVSTPTAQASAAAKTVAQAASGYLNSGAAAAAYAYPATYYANPAYYQQYAAAAGQPATPGTIPPSYYQQYAQQYQQHQQQYAAQIQAQSSQPLMGTQPYLPAATPATSQRLMPPTTTASITFPKQANTPVQPPAPTLDTSSVAQLTDALGSAGVDIRAEEEALARMAPSQQVSSTLSKAEDRSTKQNFLDPVVLAAKVKEIASNHTLTATPTAQTYMALALQSRLSTFITQAISAVDHRLETQYNRPPPLYPIDPTDTSENPEPQPMWSTLVRRDVSKQLQALEKIEREEETRLRRRRKEREQNENQNSSNNNNENDGGGGAGDGSGGGGDDDMDDGRKKKKRKPDGPGITARNMPADLRTKMSNQVANDFAGGFAKKYSWMQPGGAGAAAAAAAAPTVAVTSKPANTTTTGTAANAAIATQTTATPTSSFVRPFVTSKAGGGAVVDGGDNPDERKLTLADVMFVVGRERGHGAGKGSARVWSVAGF